VNFRTRAILPALAGVLLLHFGGSSAATAHDARGAEPADADIIVTASRRTEPLRDVTGAITALDQARLDELGVTDFAGLLGLVPGLGQRDSGAPGLGTIILRGLTSGPGQITNTVAYTIDDVPVTASGFTSAAFLLTPDPFLFDLNRVEVLKGPQGTLHGTGSLGGMIRLVTTRPDPDRLLASAGAELIMAAGGGTGGGLRARANVPMRPGTLAVRVSGYHREVPGFADNLATLTPDANRARFTGGHVAIRALPVPTLAITLSAMAQNLRSGGYAIQHNLPRTGVPQFGERRFALFFDPGSRVDSRLGTALAEWDSGAGLVTAQLSHSHYDAVVEGDLTAPVGGILTRYPPGTGLFTQQTPVMDKTTAELRFVSRRFGPVEGLAGLFWTDERVRNVNRQDFRDIATGTDQPPPAGVLAAVRVNTDYREIAGYANLSFYLSDRFDATGGLRIAENRQRVQATRTGIAFPPDVPSADLRFDSRSTTWLAAIRWRPDNGLNLWARVATGFRPGGPQPNPFRPPGAPTEIAPDTTISWEAGARASLIRRTLDLDVSLYRIDWRDIHLNTSFGGIPLLGNGGDARSQGFELAAAARPVAGLRFGGAVAHTDARIRRIDPGAEAAIGAATGDPLPTVPAWTVALTADGEQLIGNGWRVSAGSTLRFRTTMNSSFPGDRLSPNERIPELTTVDVRAGLTAGRVQVQALIENLFDRNGITLLGTAPGIRTTAVLARPRIVTLVVKAAFQSP
jgi:iron complex outermembrane receptor protein